MQSHQQQQHRHQQLQIATTTTRGSMKATSTGGASAVVATTHFTNTAKLPIETVKLLIASVSRKPNLWIRTSNGPKRSDINALWQQVGQEVHLPADICRIKWGHLRDNFRKVFIRNTLSAEQPTTWRFYNDMRFMEAAVAENVMRHHRLREQSLYWQELHSAEQRKCSSTSSHAARNDSYERSLQNHFNFSEISAFFQSNGPTSKRIKIETSESETSLNDTGQVMPNAFVQNGSAYEKSDRYPVSGNFVETDNGHNISNADVGDADDDEDDDDFDEDATSVDEGYQLTSNDSKMPIAENNFTTNFQNYNQSSKTINTETCENLNEQDSDRMFLLSLLPYLRKVKDQRKLHVRQKLQDVLIQEFG